MKPRLKSYYKQVNDSEIILVRDPGVQITLPDPGGEIRRLLELLNGERTTEEVTALLASARPGLTADDVTEAVLALNQAGLLEDAAAPVSLSAWQQERYLSNLAFFGTFASLERSRYQFQETLRGARVVMLGAGGLGSTVLYDLAGLGVGHLTVLDCDRVEARNLARQFLYSEADVGRPKLQLAVERLRAFNSEIEIVPVERRVHGPADVAPLLDRADLVICGIDTPREVYTWVNEACVAARVPWIAGGMYVARGTYYSVQPGRSGCLACLKLMQERQGDAAFTPPERINRGIGPVASLMGALVAQEAVRYLTGFAPPVSAGRYWVVDFVTGHADVGLEWPKLPDCPVCGHMHGEESRW